MSGIARVVELWKHFRGGAAPVGLLPAPDAEPNLPAVIVEEAPPKADPKALKSSWRDDYQGVMHRLEKACQSLAMMPDQIVTLEQLKAGLRFAQAIKLGDDYRIVQRYFNNTQNGHVIFAEAPQEPSEEELQHCSPYALGIGKIVVLVREMIDSANQHSYYQQDGKRVSVEDVEQTIESLMKDMMEETEHHASRPGAVIAMTASLASDAKKKGVDKLGGIAQQVWTAALMKLDFRGLEQVATDVIAAPGFPDYRAGYLVPAQTILKIIDGRMVVPVTQGGDAPDTLIAHIETVRQDTTRLIGGPSSSPVASIADARRSNGAGAGAPPPP